MLIRLVLLPLTAVINLWRLLIYGLRVALWQLSGLLLRRSERKLYARWTIDAGYPLGATHSALARWTRQGPSLLELRQDFKRLARDTRAHGLIVRVDAEGELGGLQGALIRDWLRQLRASGKHLIAHADDLDLSGLATLAPAHELLSPPGGRLYTFGARFDLPFARELLDRLGVRAQFVHLGGFKTATHQLHKAGPTLPQAWMMTTLFHNLMTLRARSIAADRGVSEAIVATAQAEAPLTPREAMRLGLTTGQTFAARVDAWLEEHLIRASGQTPPLRHLAEESPQRARARIVPMHAHLGAMPRLRLRPWLFSPRYIATLDLSGTILQDGPTGGLQRGGGIRPSEVIDALKSLGDDPRCLGVLLHINSPGGSATASDLMWDAISALRVQKPVVSFCSEVVASGGYYLAVATDRIYCMPQTIAGSIGVLAGKVDLAQLAQRAGVEMFAIAEHDSAAFTSMLHPLSEEVMMRLRDDARSFYRRFLERVGMARELDRARLHRYARGRVYTGEEALQRGLIDGVGGLEQAIEAIYQLVGTSEARAPLKFIEHHQRSLRDAVGGALLSAPTRDLLSQGARQLQTLQALRHEHLLAIAPWALFGDAHPASSGSSSPR